MKKMAIFYNFITDVYLGGRIVETELIKEEIEEIIKNELEKIGEPFLREETLENFDVIYIPII